MAFYYSNEKHIQIVIALLKAHGIRKVIVSPGTANLTLVVSMQNDNYFEMYSSVDERSAAYMACGLSAESGEPVVLSCTEATASRNYLPGLTEAFYRKLPILAITSMQSIAKVGHHIAQIIDRSSMQNDVVKLSVSIPIIKSNDELWECEIKVNQAILELKRHGGGPVHINLPTTYNQLFDIKDLPEVRVVRRVVIGDEFPKLPNVKKAVFVGSHASMSAKLIELIDRFCEIHNAVVFCDHTSGYKGKYRILYSLVTAQQNMDLSNSQPDVLIHIGEISGDYATLKLFGKEVWRVNEDGEIRDTFRKVRFVFEMSEYHFFEYYSKETIKNCDTNSYLEKLHCQLKDLYHKFPNIPFSNIWVASKVAHRIPDGSTVYLGILNSLRSWNFFEVSPSVISFSNVGGFGIDGGVSSLIGASLNNKQKLYFAIVGDLSLFYDMNVLGNRHVGNNVRILVINNGKGTEFRNFNHPAAQFSDNADKYVAAAGHFGNKSSELIKHYAQDLGYEYLWASDKQEFENVCKRFLTPEITERSILFEVFTNSQDESDALERVMNIEGSVKGKMKQFAKQVIGKKGQSVMKKIRGN